METQSERTLSLDIPPEQAGRRLDQALAALLPDYSRSQLQQWIQNGAVRVNGEPGVQRQRLHGGERIDLHVLEREQPTWQAQALPLDILYEDADLLVINKPPGRVVHPGAGNAEGTLLNALLHHDPALAALPRAGIVHRLDKDTSGLLVIARSDLAHRSLIRQLAKREVGREYLAVVQAMVISGGTIDAAIGRHPRDRTRMAVTETGKPAASHYRVQARYRAHTLLSVRLASGRTHQIRVHLAYRHFPLVGDPVYGARLLIPAESTPRLSETLRHFKRQALHATRLELIHPRSEQVLSWTVPPPADLQGLIDALADDTAQYRARHERADG